MVAAAKSFTWDAATTPSELHSLLRTLAVDYPLRENSSAKNGNPLAKNTKKNSKKITANSLRFHRGSVPGEVTVSKLGGEMLITYGRTCDAARGIGSALAGIIGSESTTFSTLGLMLDCSRNAVMTIAHAKRWLSQLALMGYNLAMLYTEDTYEVPGHPYVGYLRGKYSAAELKDLDAYAQTLGIELIGCIQTLGHLNRVLKWSTYSKCYDTATVIMEGAPETYELIDAMVGAIANSLQTRRIHIGMDEAHDLGRGKFMDKNGYERPFDIFNRHLTRVLEICAKHGVKAMIWSDMYFRMGSKTGDYYDETGVIPTDVKDAIPKNVQLVYWDYYKDNEAAYRRFISKHRELGFEPVMASCAYAHGKAWHDQAATEYFATPCVAACRAEKVKEFIVTIWGDDGAYCEMDSVLAGLAYIAELSYGGTSGANLHKRFAAVCRADYQDVSLASEMEKIYSPHYILTDDPLQGVAWKQLKLSNPKYWKDAAAKYTKLCAKLKPLAKTIAPIDFGHAFALANAVRAHVQFGLDLDVAYAKWMKSRSGRRDVVGLRAVRKDCDRVIATIDALLETFRRQWYRRNKTNGFEVIQIRFSGVRERYRETGRRLDDLIAGRSEGISELEEIADQPLPGLWASWNNAATTAYLGF